MMMNPSGSTATSAFTQVSNDDGIPVPWRSNDFGSHADYFTFDSISEPYFADSIEIKETKEDQQETEDQEWSDSSSESETKCPSPQLTYRVSPGESVLLQQTKSLHSKKSKSKRSKKCACPTPVSTPVQLFAIDELDESASEITDTEISEENCISAEESESQVELSQSEDIMDSLRAEAEQKAGILMTLTARKSRLEIQLQRCTNTTKELRVSNENFGNSVEELITEHYIKALQLNEDLKQMKRDLPGEIERKRELLKSLEEEYVPVEQEATDSRAIVDMLQMHDKFLMEKLEKQEAELVQEKLLAAKRLHSLYTQYRSQILKLSADNYELNKEIVMQDLDACENEGDVIIMNERDERNRRGESFANNGHSHQEAGSADLDPTDETEQCEMDYDDTVRRVQL